MELKSTQLRRYNKVLHNGIEKTIDCISASSVILLEDNPSLSEYGNWVDLDDVKFIEVTKDILFKYGAENFGNGDLIIKGHLVSYADCRKVFVHKSTSIELKYLHDFQNIYFALTKEELL